jgi:hypothetical protein
MSKSCVPNLLPGISPVPLQIQSNRALVYDKERATIGPGRARDEGRYLP